MFLVVMDNFIGGELKVSMQTGERLGGDVAPAEDPPSDGLVQPFFYLLFAEKSLLGSFSVFPIS